MKAISGIVVLVLTLGIGYCIYALQIQATGDRPITQQIDFAAVNSDLLSLAQAERLYFAANGRYAGLEQLRQSGVMNQVPEGRRGYVYTVEVQGGTHFCITAGPADASQTTLPTLSINETMQIRRVE